MKNLFFESKEEMLNASQEYMRPLIGRKFTTKEKKLVSSLIAYKYSTIADSHDRRKHIGVEISERNWNLFLNNLVVVFDDQIKLFDKVLDDIVLLKSQDPNVIFGYKEDGIIVETFD